METGFQQGVLGTDKAADAFKEFRVRIQDDSKTTKEALASIGIDNEVLQKNLNSGETSVIDVFNTIIKKIGETDDKNLKSYFIKKAKQSNIVTVILGGLVFVFAEYEGLILRQHFLSNPVSITSMLLATLSLVVLWMAFKTGNIWRLRLIAGFQLGMILSAWFAVIFPNILFFTASTGFSSIRGTCL